MRTRIVLAVVVMALAGSTFGWSGSGPESAIKAVLDLQQAAWNRGDIEGFMAYYWKSDDLTFQSGGRRTRGWSEVMARYKKNYSPDKMGRLEFSDLAIHVLSGDSAFVLGRFRLGFNGVFREGVFTLIFRRMRDGWRIVHDHTSSE
jgi:ketosteroid isomerase-like protein